MTLLTCYSSLTDQSSSSPSSDSIATPRNTTYGNSSKKIKRDPMVGSKVMALLTLLLKFGRQNLLVIEKGFHKNPKENEKWKLVLKCECDPTIVSNVMTVFTPYSKLADQTSLSPSNNSIAIPRKTTCEKLCKNLSVIQRSYQKL